MFAISVWIRERTLQMNLAILSPAPAGRAGKQRTGNVFEGGFYFDEFESQCHTRS